MPTRKITIINKLGLHARAAAKFVTTASRFGCEIRVDRGARGANAKSIMGVMMLAAARGAELLLSADGEDAEEALDSLEALVAERFGEEE